MAASLDKWIPVNTSWVYDISAVTVESATTTYTADSDYEVNTSTGMIKPLSSGNIVADETLTIVWNQPTLTITGISAAEVSAREGHLYFDPAPAVGARIAAMGYCSVKPEGEFGFISDDWMNASFNIEFLESTDYTDLVDYKTLPAVTV